MTIHIHIHIYIYIEREIHIYIYIYITRGAAVLEALDGADDELVDLLVHEDHVPPALEELLHVRGGHARLPVGAAEVVDVLLALLSGVAVLHEGDPLALILARALEPALSHHIYIYIYIHMYIYIYIYNNHNNHNNHNHNHNNNHNNNNN